MTLQDFVNHLSIFLADHPEIKDYLIDYIDIPMFSGNIEISSFNIHISEETKSIEIF